MRRARRPAFTLLEVILAMAILAMSVAILGELLRHGMTSAARARDLTEAQLLCESKLAEVMAGVTLPDPIQQAPCETNPEWLYSIDLQPVDQPGAVLLRVTVMQLVNGSTRPTEWSLVRLIPDPSIETASETTESESESAADDTSSTTE